MLQEKRLGVAIIWLVRDEAKADKVKTEDPYIAIVIGALEAANLLIDAVESADIVLSLASISHVPSATAIVTGLKPRQKRPILQHIGLTSPVHLPIP